MIGSGRSKGKAGKAGQDSQRRRTSYEKHGQLPNETRPHMMSGYTVVA